MHQSMWIPRGGPRGYPGDSDRQFGTHPGDSDSVCFLHTGDSDKRHCNPVAFQRHLGEFWHWMVDSPWGIWRSIFASVRIPWVCPGGPPWGFTLTGALIRHILPAQFGDVTTFCCLLKLLTCRPSIDLDPHQLNHNCFNLSSKHVMMSLWWPWKGQFKVKSRSN